jgi:digeranylgeranylglycerophospholipid reductase
MKNKNVLVVGSGPAGCSAAFFLKYFDKNNELNVTLIDRLTEENFTKYHRMCGEAISEAAFQELNPLGPTNVSERIELIRQNWPNGSVREAPSKGFIINRGFFLRDIQKRFEQKSGILQNDCFQNLVCTNESVKVKTTSRTSTYDYVVAADGAMSQIRNCSKSNNGKIKTLVQYVINEEPKSHNAIEFFYDEKYGGDYKWIFPNGNFTKIGYPRVGLEDFKKEAVIEKHVRPVGYGYMENYVNNRVLFVGDAAFQCNPLTNGGIGPGMIAGKTAAKSIVEGNPISYDTAWKRMIFSSQVFVDAYQSLSRLTNQEMQDLIKPLNSNPAALSLPRVLLFHRKYMKIYKAFKLSQKVGW